MHIGQPAFAVGERLLEEIDDLDFEVAFVQSWEVSFSSGFLCYDLRVKILLRLFVSRAKRFMFDFVSVVPHSSSNIDEALED